MSFIEFIGGVSAEKATDLENALERLEGRLDAASAHIMDINMALKKLTEDYEHRLAEQDKAIEQMKDVMTVYTKVNPLPPDLVKRMDDMERMQRYLQNSQGRCLNGLDDVKKELYNLYQHNITPPDPKELEKSVAKYDNEIKLMDILHEKFGDLNVGEKGAFARMLKANGLETLEDLKKIPYYDLDALARVGEKNLAILQCIYEEYSEVDPKKVKPITDNNLKKAIFDNSEGFATDQRLKILRALQRNGINDLQDLSKVSLATVANFPNIGVKSMKVITSVYENCIQA